MDRFHKLSELEEQIYDLTQEQKIQAASLWREVEIKLDLRGRALKYVKEKETIEVMEDSGNARDREMLQKIRDGKAVPYAQHPVGRMDTPMGSALPKVVFKKPSLWQRIKNSVKSDD